MLERLNPARGNRIRRATRATCHTRRARVERSAAATHEAARLGGDADDEPVRIDVSRDDRAGGHERKLPDRRPRDDHRPCAECRTAADDGRRQPTLVGIPRLDVAEPRRPWAKIVCEHDARSDKCAVFDRHALPDSSPVLDRDVVADPGTRLDEAVITDVAVRADRCPRQNVCERPDARAVADVVGFDERRRVDEGLGIQDDPPARDRFDGRRDLSSAISSVENARKAATSAK